MRKVLDKCNKCHNSCKAETETGARLILCKEFLSKRSVAVQLEKDRVRYIPLTNNR